MKRAHPTTPDVGGETKIRPTPPKSAPGTTPSKTAGGGVRGVGSSSGAITGRSSSGTRFSDVRAVDGLRTLQKTNPKKARGIRAAGAALGYAQGAAIGVGLAAIGGVYSTPYLGATNYNNYYRGGYYALPESYFCPWGFSYYGGRYNWSFNFGLGYCFSSYSPWYWTTYLSCWYPIWYSYYRPYSSYYWNPTSYETIVYRTVYVDDEASAGYETAPAAQSNAPAATAPPAASTSSALSTAADRYLTLGDQAFREGRYMDTVQLYAKAVEFAPNEGALYMVLGDALFAAGDYHYGAYAIRRGLELDHSLVSVEVDKHEFYPDPSDFDRHLAVLESYVLEHPYDRDARLVLALNNLFGARPAAAVDILEVDAAAALRGDEAAELILEAARKAQFGVGSSR